MNPIITLARFGHRVAPTACSIAGALGVVATGYSAAKAGEEVGAYETRTGEAMPVRRKIRTYAKPAIIGAASIACIFTGDRLHARRYAALSAAASVIQERARLKDVGLQTLQQDIYKEDKQTAVQAADQAVAQDIYEMCRTAGIEPIDTGTGQELWYEPISKQWFLASEKHVLESEYHLNRNLQLRGDSEFNEFLRFLGLKESPGFSLIHWDLYEGETVYGYKWADFVHHHGLTLRDGPEYNAIFYPFEPHLSER